MRLTAKQYAQTLYDSLQDTAAKDHDKILENFAKILAINNDTKLMDQIEAEYDKIEKSAKGIKIAEVTSAHPLEKHTEKEIIEQLNKLAGMKVELRKKVDEKILGGVVIKLDDTLIDASVKKSLEELKGSLSN
jgi:F-type H+-transporting ATPase subunit delta